MGLADLQRQRGGGGRAGQICCETELGCGAVERAVGCLGEQPGGEEGAGCDHGQVEGRGHGISGARYEPDGHEECCAAEENSMAGVLG